MDTTGHPDHKNGHLSVVVETRSIGEHPEADGGALLGQCVHAVAEQLRAAQGEILVICGDAVDRAIIDAAVGDEPLARVIEAGEASYVQMKWIGTTEARGELVAYIDGDCVPGPDWASSIRTALVDADVSSGRTVYQSRSFLGEAARVFDFGFVSVRANQAPAGIIYSNLAMRTSVAQSTPPDFRFNRSGSCSDLYRRLREGGARIVYSPGQLAAHHDDWRHGGWVRKRIRNGVDTAKMARHNGEGSPLTPVVIAGRRLGHDGIRLARRYDADVAAWKIPLLLVVAVIARSIEAATGMVSAIRPDAFGASYG